MNRCQRTHRPLEIGQHQSPTIPTGHSQLYVPWITSHLSELQPGITSSSEMARTKVDAAEMVDSPPLKLLSLGSLPLSVSSRMQLGTVLKTPSRWRWHSRPIVPHRPSAPYEEG
jgi:hypothetical protein